MPESGRMYGGLTPEQRQSNRRAQLLEACLEVVGQVGVLDLTVEAVCAQAGLSKKFFYESFDSRDEAIVEVFNQLLAVQQEALGGALARDRDIPQPERFRLIARALVRAVSADPRFARLYVEAPRLPATSERRFAAYDSFARLIVSEGLLGVGEKHPHAFTSAVLIVTGATGVISRHASGDLDGRSEDDVVDTIAGIGEAAAAYLLSHGH